MVSYPKYFLVLTLIILFQGCDQKPITENLHSYEEPVTNYYTSIDGLWRCTEETSLKFPEGVLEPMILISGSQFDNLRIKGCFLWDGRYHDKWELMDVKYDEVSKQLVFVDRNESVFQGIVSDDLISIHGIARAGDPDNTVEGTKLDFVREKVLSPARLFFVRTPGKDGSIQYSYQKPEQTQDGLSTGHILDYANDTTSFYELMIDIINQKYGRIESLIILKDGKLVLEEYFYDHDRMTLHNIHSCTKSIVSLLLGKALNDFDANVEQPIFDFYPDYDSLKRDTNQNVNLKHLLTMHSGFGEHEDREEGDFDSRYHYLLSLPMDTIPGTEFRYCNDCSEIIGGVIQSLSGKQVDTYAEEVLFTPLGINTFKWEKEEDGSPHCHSDLYMLPRDEAKIGQLVLNEGKWNGKQIIPQSWIEESTMVQVEETEFYNYGYYWWHRSNVNTPWWRESGNLIDNELDKVIALGYGGQYIVIIKDLDMVIVTTASDYANGDMARSKIPMVVERIVPLFR